MPLVLSKGDIRPESIILTLRANTPSGNGFVIGIEATVLASSPDQVATAVGKGLTQHGAVRPSPLDVDQVYAALATLGAVGQAMRTALSTAVQQAVQESL